MESLPYPIKIKRKQNKYKLYNLTTIVQLKIMCMPIIELIWLPPMSIKVHLFVFPTSNAAGGSWTVGIFMLELIKLYFIFINIMLMAFFPC